MSVVFALIIFGLTFFSGAHLSFADSDNVANYVILNPLTPTPEREEAVAFGTTYLQGDVVLAERDKDYIDETSFIDSLRNEFTKSFITNDRYKMFLSGIQVTFYITFGVFILSTILGIALAFMARCGSRVTKVISSFYCNFFTSIPDLVIILIVFYIVFQKVDIDPALASIIALTLPFSAYMCSNFSDSYDQVNKQEVEAARAMGFSAAGAFLLISLPRTAKNALSGYREAFIDVFKESSIVGYIAVEDLTCVSDIITSQTFSPFFTLLVSAAIYAAVIWIVILIFTIINKNVSKRKVISIIPQIENYAKGGN